MITLLLPKHNQHYQSIVDHAVSSPRDYPVAASYALVEIRKEYLLILKLIHGSKLHRPFSAANAEHCDYVLNSDA